MVQGKLIFTFWEKGKYTYAGELTEKKISEKRLKVWACRFPQVIPYIGNWRNIKPETYKDLKRFKRIMTMWAYCISIRDISGKIVAFNGRHTTGGDA